LELVGDASVTHTGDTMNITSRFPIALLAACLMLFAVPAAASDHQHDFDFEFGAWHAHLSRLLHPLSGSHIWTTYSGTSVVHKIWNGNANFGEFDVRGPAGRIHGMSLRLYNPQTGQWSVYWANIRDGLLTQPLVGAITKERGEFESHDTLNGRPILARFIFSDFTPNSFRITQSFSADNGRTWEANWISDFTR
jgi:hypothetical protein